jgi:hypothetical protein
MGKDQTEFKGSQGAMEASWDITTEEPIQEPFPSFQVSSTLIASKSVAK